LCVWIQIIRDRLSGGDRAQITRRQRDILASKCVCGCRERCNDGAEECRGIIHCDRYVERLRGKSGVCCDRSDNVKYLADNRRGDVILNRILRETLRLWQWLRYRL
jgi:hypothetical protein